MFGHKTSKATFLWGMAAGAGAIIILGGVYYLGASSGGGLPKSNNNQVAAVNQPTNPTAEPTPDVSKVTVGKDDNIKGAKNAKLTLIEFSDFQCPYCAKFTPSLDQVLSEYDGQVRLVFKQFPLSSLHPEAQKAAEAAECAADQGKFWEMHDALFIMNTAQTMSLTNYKAKAAELGLDTTKFNSCLDNGSKAQKVREDYQEGISAGVTGTPGTFVGDQFVAGAVSFAQLKSVIDQQL